MATVLSTTLPNLPRPRVGKVREVYELGEQVLIVATDRISAFDVVMSNGIPGKGQILNQMSAFWFEHLRDVCPNHMLTISDEEIAGKVGAVPELSGRAMLAIRAEPLSIECVVRGYISGSLYKQYLAEGPRCLGLDLPEGLREGDRLPAPIFTPATKATEGHDENIAYEEAEGLVGAQRAAQARAWSVELYRRAASHSMGRGLILADTKFEFGLAAGGLILIDEALTPDSSRYWDASLWSPGRPQPSFDKQFVRDYLEDIGWNKQPPGPELPPEIVEKTREKYLEAYRKIADMQA